ncbi:hypothetical protein [Bradyrhizobium sp. SSUT77]|uniref:hypothetical protein n=1 Tax=Bradyrhizobium sp. SSUT77 TaxID=3040603 RepID=UPI00244C526B|nr:hypothetical protein [Bradyrhizobium sp. SSUT77]MDH2342330.1 hypothetical protein [Bradyrhizobium sp. SSUT77]
MIVTAGACGCLGVLYGVGTSSGPISATMLGLAYGIIGILVGIPVSASINITRRLWQ